MEILIAPSHEPRQACCRDLLSMQQGRVDLLSQFTAKRIPANRHKFPEMLPKQGHQWPATATTKPVIAMLLKVLVR